MVETFYINLIKFIKKVTSYDAKNILFSFTMPNSKRQSNWFLKLDVSLRTFFNLFYLQIL